MIRDQALFVSGLLVEKLGGPSVKPYQPGGLWEAVGYTDSNTANFKQDDGEKLYRRSMYTFWKRTSPPPSMGTFDAPSRETCTVRRPDKHALPGAGTDERQAIRRGGPPFRRADHGRRRRLPGLPTDMGVPHTDGPDPSERELSVLRRFWKNTAELCRESASSDRVHRLGNDAADPDHLDRDKSHDPDLAAWTMVASLLLNLDEAVTKG